MTAAVVVEVEVGAELAARLGEGLVGFQVDVVVLHAPPQALDEDVIQPAAATVHADLDVVVTEHAREALTGELCALVGVEDQRRVVTFQGLCERLDAEGGVEGVGKLPGEHPPARLSP